jgi:hypothetical protein
MRSSGGLTLNQDIHLPNSWVGFLGGSVNYVGARPSEFSSAAGVPRVWMPAYTQFNLRTGARYQSWLFNLYANNVANRRGIVGISTTAADNLGNTGGYYTTVIQPRTLGITASRSF